VKVDPSEVLDSLGLGRSSELRVYVDQQLKEILPILVERYPDLAREHPAVIRRMAIYALRCRLSEQGASAV